MSTLPTLYRWMLEINETRPGKQWVQFCFGSQRPWKPERAVAAQAFLQTGIHTLGYRRPIAHNMPTVQSVYIYILPDNNETWVEPVGASRLTVFEAFAGDWEVFGFGVLGLGFGAFG